MGASVVIGVVSRPGQQEVPVCLIEDFGVRADVFWAVLVPARELGAFAEKVRREHQSTAKDWPWRGVVVVGEPGQQRPREAVALDKIGIETRCIAVRHHADDVVGGSDISFATVGRGVLERVARGEPRWLGEAGACPEVEKMLRDGHLPEGGGSGLGLAVAVALLQVWEAEPESNPGATGFVSG